MLIKTLRLANVRTFYKEAVFEFQPDINLLVGVNGAGKSTVLDVLRMMFSASLPKFTTASPKDIIPFNRQEDISIGADSLNAVLVFELRKTTLRHRVFIQREQYVDSPDAKVGQVREQAFEAIELNELTDKDGKVIKTLRRNLLRQELVVYFSPHRSVVEPSRKTSRKGSEAAFLDALEPRGLVIREFALWWLAQVELSQEDPSKKRLLEALNYAIDSFLEGYSNLRATSEPKVSLLIDKEGKTLDIRQLSDGERSILALILDLAKRLALANPSSDNPVQDGNAIVLIDEIDLHLHPSWQRTICKRLVRTFPNCQFIVTTHSPQIIGELEPEKIILINNGEITMPRQALGMDSNWVLRHLMGTDERDPEAKRKLQAIEKLIEEENYDQAILDIDALRDQYQEFPELAGLQAQIDMLLFLDEDEGVEE